MSDYTTHTDGQPSLARAFRTMPKWKALLLTVSLVVGILGVGGMVAANRLRAAPQTVTVTTPVPAQRGTALPSGSSGFVGGSGSAAPAEQQTTVTTKPAEPSLTDKVSPYLTGVGLSFFVGIVVGLISRTFIKLATMLAGLAIAAVAALHYFNVNIDMTSVQAQTTQATSWLQGLLTQVMGVVSNHLPSAGGGMAGFLFGLKRK